MMSRKRVVLLVAVVLVGAFVVLLWLTPVPPPPAPPAPPPVAKRPAAPLQSDAEGSYVPGYAFTVNGFRFTGFTLRPEADVLFAQTTVACLDARITAQSVHLRCDDPQVGTVIIDGRFLTRVVTNRFDSPVLAAVVTVRTGSGEVLYSARDAFRWEPRESNLKP